MHTLPQHKLRIVVLAVVLLGLMVPANAFAHDHGHRWWRGGRLAATPSSISFGTVPVGQSTSQTATLVNTASYRLSIWRVYVSEGFIVSGLPLPTTIESGQRITFTVTFKPVNSSAVSGELSLAWGHRGHRLTLPVSGNGSASARLSVSPTTLSFGSVPVGTTRTLAATLTASGASTVVSSVTTTNPEFTVSGMRMPVTVSTGQSVPFSVTFTPKTSGTATANLSFVNSETESPVIAALTGSGSAQAADHTVALSWGNSTSTITGYNVYRGSVSGGPYSKVNSAVDAGTSYSDDSVESGKTYYYVVTAINSAGTESAHSNQATAVVP